MKISILFLIAVFLFTKGMGQDKYFTKNGKIRFFSRTSFESIDAQNKSVTSVIDIKTGQLQFSLLMKGFEFKKAAMQEHFNEDYVESNKFPRSEFRGMVVNNNIINYSKEGSYPVKVKGKLTLHGISKDIETDGNIEIKNGKIAPKATFVLLLSDFNVSIPSLVKDKIAKTVNVSIDCILEPLKTN